jgi:hypothetical protein
MTRTVRLKSKNKYFLDNQIVRYEGRFGYVKSTTSGIDVRFPDPKDSACYQDVTFNRDGSLLGDGKQVLYKHLGRHEALAMLCRDLSCKLGMMDTRIMNNKEVEIVEEEDGGF